jgi:hypothetical protein
MGPAVLVGVMAFFVLISVLLRKRALTLNNQTEMKKKEGTIMTNNKMIPGVNLVRSVAETFAAISSSGAMAALSA